MAEITLWAKQIIYIILFAAFVELLLPSNSMQRFIRLVLGMYVMLAVINPALNIVHNSGLPASLTTMSSNKNDTTEVEEAIEKLTGDKDKVVTELYKKELARQVKAVVTGIAGVGDAKVIADINEEKGKEAGKIKSLSVFVIPGASGANNLVHRVVIGEKNVKYEEIDQELQARIKRTIADIYQLRNDQVQVKRFN